jgi:hypothetical protein
MYNPFEDLFTEIMHLQMTLDQVLTTVRSQPTQAEIEKPLSRKEAAKFLNVSYGKLCSPTCKVPSIRKFGKYYYLKSDLLNYLKSDDRE